MDEILGTDAAIDLLLGKKKTLKEKILSFFKGAARDYAGDAALSKEARKFLRTFKKMFDAFAEKNQSVKAEKSEGGETVSGYYTGNAYSYDLILKNKNIEISNIPIVSDAEIKKYKSDSILFGKEMRENAAKADNVKNTDTRTYLFCSALKEDVLITRESFKHGAERMDAAYIAVSKNISAILQTSILVNELSPRNGTNGGYVLLGVAEIGEDYVFIRSIVNKKTWKLEEFEELAAIKKKSIKKEDVGFKPPHYIRKNGYVTSSIISITDFLENVKSIPMINEVLSDDVAKKLGITRSKGSLSPNLRYSMDEDPKLPRTAGTMSVGQYKQRVADLTKTKSYMKNQVYDIVKKLPMADMASEKTRMQVTEAAWQIFCDRWTAHFISF